MAIIPSGTLNPHGAPVLRKEIITNSISVVMHDSIKLSSGFAALNTAGVLTFGHVTGVSTANGVGVNTTGAAGADIGSFVGTYTAASDNQTVAKVTVECDISKFTLYNAEVSATIGTTTGSNLSGYNMDLSDENTLDETSAVTTTAQYYSHGLAPSNSAQAYVNIRESVVFGV